MAPELLPTGGKRSTVIEMLNYIDTSVSKQHFTFVNWGYIQTCSHAQNVQNDSIKTLLRVSTFCKCDVLVMRLPGLSLNCCQPVAILFESRLPIDQSLYDPASRHSNNVVCSCKCYVIVSTCF